MYICMRRANSGVYVTFVFALTIGDSRCTQSVSRHLNPFVSVYRIYIYIYELSVSRVLYFILDLLYMKKHTNTFAILNFIHSYILKSVYKSRDTVSVVKFIQSINETLYLYARWTVDSNSFNRNRLR